MRLARGVGLYMQRERYGVVVCPWCGSMAAAKKPGQITCGRMGCQEKQKLARPRKRNSELKFNA